MKIQFLFTILAFSYLTATAQWQPQGNQIKTRWTENITPDNVLPEYPRPIMERSEWKNLNGLWDYSIQEKNTHEAPIDFDGKILVPFCIESSLSGVQKHLGPENTLWYRRTFTVPSKWNTDRILLHFGAVDWETEVWVNDIKVGEHTGGYTPFYFDISPALNKGKENTLLVKVNDPSSKGFQPRGKQSERPWLLWYTTVSGIWQTVWLEPVPKNYIKTVKTTPDIDKGILTVQIGTESIKGIAEVKVFDEGKIIASAKGINGLPISLSIPNLKLWSPESPHLYDLEIGLIENGKTIDKVKSYAAMRKFSTAMGKDHIIRLQLNNKDLFQFGTLDQGYWPDGLYTAPTDEALLYDIKQTKEFGYNMIRKHIKVEPARWYTHCDREGIIVWQDMPSGDETPELQWRQFFTGEELQRTPESENNFRKEWKEIIDCLYSYPCIGTWVVFNEGWGQFKTIEIANWTKTYDPTRIVDAGSGGNHYHEGGDLLDLHNYPEPQMYLFDTKRANVLGEYGGIGYKVEKHTWEAEKLNVPAKTGGLQEATDKYEEYAQILKNLIIRGYTAAVYTQITDIEGELNGLMTYDREVIKLDKERLQRINKEICNSFSTIE